MIPDAITSPEMQAVPPRPFRMGASLDDKFATDTERPAHSITFAHAFAIGRYPVTVGEYRALVPLHAPGEPEDLPVVNVSWHEAQAYCRSLGEVLRRPFRLPTEAEWEYACRGGSGEPFATGPEIGLSEANFLYAETGERIGRGERTPVGSFPPNGFGLHDLHGNVSEWVKDTWHPSYLGAPADGKAWLDGGDARRRVIRGGAWDHLPRLLRSAWRDALPADARRDNVGFRVAVTLPPEPR